MAVVSARWTAPAPIETPGVPAAGYLRQVERWRAEAGAGYRDAVAAAADTAETVAGYAPEADAAEGKR